MRKVFTGDYGDTSLYGGVRVTKNDPRIAAYGDVDEVNSFIGLARSRLVDKSIDKWLYAIQKDLLVLGADLAMTEGITLAEDRVKALDDEVQKLEKELPLLKNFILPAGAPSAALLHVARSVCRRAERTIVALDHPNKERILKYVNRLNYLLFLFARKENIAAGVKDEIWKPGKEQ